MPSANLKLAGALEGPALARPSRERGPEQPRRGWLLGTLLQAPPCHPQPAGDGESSLGPTTQRPGALCSEATCASVAWWGSSSLGIQRQAASSSSTARVDPTSGNQWACRVSSSTFKGVKL